MTIVPQSPTKKGLKDDEFFDTVEDISMINEKDKNQSTWSCVRETIGAFINDDRIQTVITILIIVNAMMMGIATYPLVRDNPKVDQVFEQIDNVFLITFTIELIFQLTYHGIMFFKDGWLLFDFVIILMSWSFSSVQIIRAFRIFRALRIIKRIKSIREVVSAFIVVLPRLLYIMILMALMFYISVVLFTTLYKDLYKEGLTEVNYFSRLDFTSFTLFQIMCLDDWSQIAREVMEAEPNAWIPFVSYVIIAAFIIVNLIVAVLCDSIFEIRQKETDALAAEEGKIEGDSLEALRNEIALITQIIAESAREQERTTNMIEYFARQAKLKATNVRSPYLKSPSLKPKYID